MACEKGGLIKKTDNYILKESFGLCPYLASMQREKKRNAIIQDEDKWTEEMLETDILDAKPLMEKVKAHIRQRTDRQTKTRWIALANEYATEIVLAAPEEKETIRRYLESARNNVEKLKKKEKSKRWVRTDKRRLEERVAT